MSDKLKKFLNRDLDELKRNKVRVIALGVCFVVLLIFWISDNTSGGEEISLDETTPAENPPAPVTKDLPVKVLPVEKSPDGVTIVLGANADALFIGDPFAGEEKPKPPPKSSPKPNIPLPPVAIQTPPQPPQIEKPKAQEKIFLTGTAISGDIKTAMFLRGKETLFLTVGDEIGGRRIVDISSDFVTFADGTSLTIRGTAD